MKLFSTSTKKRSLLSATTASQQQQQTHDDLQTFRRNLPVFQFRRDLVQAIAGTNNHKVVLVVAETGSGKSTQIPSYLLQSHHCMAVTQPRRVAAMTLARRVAAEQSSVLGRRIGYRVRFDDCTSQAGGGDTTQLTYCTDGMLLREAMADPKVTNYSVVFLDECHERSLQTDILLGVMQRARKARAGTQHPLQLVVMSATLEVETLVQFFGGPDAVTIISIPGRQFPVQLLYTAAPVADYIEASLSTIVQIHTHEEPGDILVFLPGQEEIEDLANLLKQYLQEQDDATLWTGDCVEEMQSHKSNSGSSSNHRSQLVGNGVLICLLYAALPPEAQMLAFEEKPVGCRRKIILATNVAETSVTLPAIRYVVDSGKYKCRQVLSTGMESLTVQNVSQAQAAQRAGRSGRVQEGVCFRLYTEDAFHGLPASNPPEILRVSLSQVVLQLKGMGVSDPTNFDYVTPPDRASIVRAMKLLYALNALDEKMELTVFGKKLAKLPLDPVFGNLLLKSSEYSCTKEMLTAVSVLSAENLFYRPLSSEGGIAAKAGAAHRRFASHEGDLPTFLNVYTAWQNEAVYVSFGGIKSQNKLLKTGGSRGKLNHGNWCQQNYISGRSLVRAHHIRSQLMRLCGRSTEQNGLGMDVQSTCGTDRKKFLICVAAGLFLQVASRIKVDESSDTNSRGGRSGTVSTARGRYRTKVGNETVSIHPTSTMFGRNPAPDCVVYSELLSTKRTYIRGVTQIREEWLKEVAPNFYTR
jgi:ATP-dependent RNA helicase DHX8/PRP22